MAILGFALSICLTALIMPVFIKKLKQHNINQSVSEYALDSYKQKEKTPIMGGLIFVLAPLIIYIIITIGRGSFADPNTNLVILSFISYCLVGFADDFTIIQKHNNDGLSPRLKLFIELLITIVLFFAFKKYLSFEIDVPFINGGVTVHWLIFLPFMVLLYQAEANAVNFTDGMDGLCAGVSLIALIPFCVLTYKAGMHNLLVFIMCVMGGLIGYLFFNFHPAKIFMGDSGSLALGALFASMSIVLNKEIALFVIGGVFVFEMFCVCVQLSSVKLFHKRVFSYTPIHYAFVLKGKKEVNVVLMFYVLAIILAVVGLFIGLS